MTVFTYTSSEMGNDESTAVVSCHIALGGIKYAFGFIIGRKYIKIMLVFIHIYLVS